MQKTDTSKIKHPTSGGYLIKQWKKKFNDKNNNRQKQNFLKSTKYLVQRVIPEQRVCLL